MSYAEAIARVHEIEARFGLTSTVNVAPTGTFDEVLQYAQAQFQDGPTRLNPLSNDYDQSAPEALAARRAAPFTRSGGAVSRAAATRGLTPELDLAITRTANRYGIPPQLVKAVARAESGFRSDAVSSAGAQGLMQLMPATARGLGVSDPFDPEQSIEGGAKYLRNALRAFDGDVTKAVASYNAGVGAVRKYGGVPPYPETRAYVDKVLGYAAALGFRATKVSL